MRHEHYDPEGNLTGFTVVVQEPEWDDEERTRMLALARYEAGVCACGLHEDIASDRNNFFTFEDKTCPVCRGTDRYRRIQAAADEEARKQLGEKAPPAAPLPQDGRRTFVRMMSEDEVQTLRASKSRPGGVGPREDRADA